MQKASFSQKWTFYARPKLSAPVPPYDMSAVLVSVLVPMLVLLDWCFVPTECLVLLFYRYKPFFVVF